MRTVYHPQMDGLVKRFNRTLIVMLAKTTEKGGRDWDYRLPVFYLLTGLLSYSLPWSCHSFLYRDAIQDYQIQDLRLSSTTGPEERKKLTNLREYGSELAKQMSEAWELARHR